MLAKIQLTSESLRVIEGMKKLPKALTLAIQVALDASALEVQNRAKELAPYRTGNLRRSITRRFVPTSGGFAAAVGTNVVYAAIHEFGGMTGRGHHTHIKPFNNQGYFRPAIDEKRVTIEALFDRFITRALKSLGLI